MGGVKAGGVILCCGMTGSGKTTAARRLQHEMALKWGLRKVTMDLESAGDWQHVPHAASAEEVLTDCYIKRVDPKVWTPRDERERAKFFMAAAHWGGLSVLIDGLPMIANAHNFDEEMRQCFYRHRHGALRLPSYWFPTAQRFSLVHRHVLAACKEVRIFRQAPGVDADRVQHEFGVKPEVTTALERGEYVPIVLGFAEEDAGPGEHPPSVGPTSKA